MKLDECIELGKACGCETLSECFDNIDLHACNLFIYEQINDEINELCKDIQDIYELPEACLNEDDRPLVRVTMESTLI